MQKRWASHQNRFPARSWRGGRRDDLSLHFILDGYNIIRANPVFQGGTLNDEREGLLHFIQLHKPQGSPNNRITVVFDSRENIFGGSDKRGNIQIQYSRGRTADDAIVDMVEESPHPRQIIVVTNDRGIKQRIRGTGAKAIGVQEFLSRKKG